MTIILKTNKVNLFVSPVLFVFWHHSPKVLDTPRNYKNESRTAPSLRLFLGTESCLETNELSIHGTVNGLCGEKGFVDVCDTFVLWA
jgi:hypothetical protein